MTRIRRISLVAAIVGTALAGTQPAYAAGLVQQTLIANLQVTTSTQSVLPFGIINFPGGAIGGTAPSRAIVPRFGMAIDVSSALGKAVWSTATAAFLAGKKVSITGTGTCIGGATSNSMELISSITVLP
jgi:hypothetical protein